MRYCLKMGWLMGGVIAFTGCGGEGGGGPGSEDGTVVEPWTGYCTGIFTEDTPIIDAFDEPAFTARSGDEFLLSAFDDTFGERAEFVFMAEDGPDTFEVEPSAEGEWPFTSNCTIGGGVPYYAVYNDVSVFADEELNTELCELSGGSVLPAGSNGRGFAYAGTEGNSAIYEVILGPFSAECGGADRGYILVPQTTSFGSRTWLVPLFSFIGPD